MVPGPRMPHSTALASVLLDLGTHTAGSFSVTFGSRVENSEGGRIACPGSLVRASAALFASEQDHEHEQRDEQADTARRGMYVAGHDQERVVAHDNPRANSAIPTTKTTPFLHF